MPSGFPSVYEFSRPLNRLDYDPAYPKNPQTLAQYIRKLRKEKGLTIGELAREIGVHKFTLSDWEIRGKVPRMQHLPKKLRRAVPGAEKFC